MHTIQKPLAGALALGLALLLGACDDAGGSSTDATAPRPDSDRGIDFDDVAVPDATSDGTPGADLGPAPDGSQPGDAQAPGDGGGPDLDATPGDGGVTPDGAPPPDAMPLDAFIPDHDPLCMVDPDLSIPAPEVGPADCRGRGDDLRIRDLRDVRCPDWLRAPTRLPGEDVVLEEAVVVGVFDTDFAVQDPEGGPFSALWVYNQPMLDISDLVPGTRVRLSGQVIDFFTLFELVPDRDGLEILGPGPAPDPTLLANPTWIADDGPLGEAYESQLVRFEAVRVTNTVPDCPQEFGMFELSGGLRVDDDAPFDYTASRGDVMRSITGVASFSFDHRKILPRGSDDIVSVGCGGIPDKCVTAECPVTEDAAESGQVVITELQVNPVGDDLSREYVELYNPGRAAIILDGWRLQDCAGHAAPLSGRLAAGDYLVVAASLDEDENGGVPAQLLMRDLFLTNGFGSVLLFDANEALVDQVRYGPEDPWPAYEPGQALELIDPAADNRVGSNWQAAEQRYGEGGRGSPGAATEEN